LCKKIFCAECREIVIEKGIFAWDRESLAKINKIAKCCEILFPSINKGKMGGERVVCMAQK
jgi:hypothetical protein